MTDPKDINTERRSRSRLFLGLLAAAAIIGIGYFVVVSFLIVDEPERVTNPVDAITDSFEGEEAEIPEPVNTAPGGTEGTDQDVDPAPGDQNDPATAN